LHPLGTAALIVGWQRWLKLTNMQKMLVCASPCLQIWYGVPAAAAAALDAAMRDALPHLFDKDHLLLHKLITMLSPAQLAARGVPVCRAVQVKRGSHRMTLSCLPQRCLYVYLSDVSGISQQLA
jgi:hypothetical protein